MGTAGTLGFVALAIGSVISLLVGAAYPEGAIVIALAVWFVLLVFTALVKTVNR